MKAMVLLGQDKLSYQEVPTPEPMEGEVLIKIMAAGICGSDIPRVLGDAAHYYPIILGHECAGQVVEFGDGVTDIAIGDRVSVAPLLPCMVCEDCQLGHYAQCKHYSFIGSRRQGAFAEYLAVPKQNIVRFEQHIEYEQAAFFEPATVALHGLMRTGFQGGGSVAVLGAGTIGLFTAQWARIYGAKRVVLLDLSTQRLALARKMGFSDTVCTAEDGYMDILRDMTHNRGFEYVLETAGAVATMKMAFELAQHHGQVCFIGTPTRDLHFTPTLFEQMNRKEFMLTGSWMSYSAPFPGREWSLVSHFLANGQLRIDRDLVYQHYPLSRLHEGFELYKVPEHVHGKIMMVSKG